MGAFYTLVGCRFSLYNNITCAEGIRQEERDKAMNDSQANDPFVDFPPVALPAPYPAFRLSKGIIIDFEAYEYEVQGLRIPMTLRERQLLFALVKKHLDSPRGYLPVRFLVEWMIPHSTDYTDPEQSIAQIVSGIRKKLGEVPHKPRFLISDRGKGYQLRPELGYGNIVAHCVNKPERN